MATARGDLLEEAYKLCRAGFGPRNWWPGDTSFEVMVGAILTQNTNWGNVEKAIANIKKAGALDPHKLYNLHPRSLAALIRPAGYFNVKTRRLRSFLKYLIDKYGGNPACMSGRQTETLRGELLAVKGIGPETADSILLYALGKPVFVVDTYTHRILYRHHLASDESTYDDIRSLFMDNLRGDVPFYNDFHAQFVEVGKNFCRPKNPRCNECPLNGWNW